MLGNFRFYPEVLKDMATYYPEYEGYNKEIKDIADYIIWQFDKITDFNPREIQKVCNALNKPEVNRINGVSFNDAIRDTMMLAFFLGMMHAENLRLDFFPEEDYTYSPLKAMEKELEDFDDDDDDDYEQE